MKLKEIKVWKVLQSEYLYREPWLTVRKLKMELPNGSIIPSYYILDYPSWICVIALTRAREMILVRQYRPGIGLVLPELCAGVVDSSDTSCMEAAKRELLEETGYGKGNWRLFMTTSANPGTHSNMTYCFLATDLESIAPPSPEITEDLSVELWEQDEVLQLLKDNGVFQAIHAAALWKYFYEQKGGDPPAFKQIS